MKKEEINLRLQEIKNVEIILKTISSVNSSGFIIEQLDECEKLAYNLLHKQDDITTDIYSFSKYTTALFKKERILADSLKKAGVLTELRKKEYYLFLDFLHIVSSFSNIMKFTEKLSKASNIAKELLNENREDNLSSFYSFIIDIVMEDINKAVEKLEETEDDIFDKELDKRYCMKCGEDENFTYIRATASPYLNASSNHYTCNNCKEELCFIERNK